MTVPEPIPGGYESETSIVASNVAVHPSINLFADSIFANGLGMDPTGLLEDGNEPESAEELLPVFQRMSPTMLAAHASVDRKLGAFLTSFTLAELQALQTQVTLREKQLLTAADADALFSEPEDSTMTDTIPESAADTNTPHPSADEPHHLHKLSQLEYARIRQENVDLSNVVCIRATADLVHELRQPETAVDLPGRRQGKTPLAAATAFVASALRLTNSTVDKRLTLANTMWPTMRYRRSSTATPRLGSQLQRGRISFDSAVAAHEKLTSIRQAVRRAGGNEATADDMVRHKEQDFVRHALRNDPHTFGRFAKAQSDAVTNELIGPAQTLTHEEVKHEKGIFYEAPIGDSLHRLSLVVDDAELLHLTAIREFATKLDSTISTLRARAHQDATGETFNDDTSATSRPATNLEDMDRLTPEDVDLGIEQLFDGQTKAERWLNTLLDFTLSGLMLHKTYDPHATPEEQRRRDAALKKAAEHSEMLSDILGMTTPTPTDGSQTTDHDEVLAIRDSPAAPDEPLASFVPPGYQLLRPNLDLIVEISLRDLVSTQSVSQGVSATQTKKLEDSELEKILELLKHETQGLSAPVASPGNIRIDHSLARQQACHQKIIPMVLGTKSQPLDVGRAQRSFSPAMRRALHVRDRGCVVPGCSRPAAWCEPHHLKEWANDGSTSVENGVLLCRQHHTAVHRDLLIIHMDADGRPSCSLPPVLDPTQTRYRNVYWTA